ncbi:hypothetical protein HGRIS_010279 [Hohenbuehelia grisea]|uniref:Lysine-specific metallo-endopeptidase domain-containing protein n=1 Tax=Hohenbuehelia grisea TaxID=104357 RepID=A0ABR3J475_9AGAR
MPEIFALSAKPQGRLSSTAIASKKPPFERGSLLRTDRDDAIKYLTKLGPKPTENNSNLHRYIKWFGRYNDERYRSVYTLFSAMKSHPLDSTEFTCATFMQCKKNTSFLRAFTLVAFVITPDIGKINLCSNFWKESDEAQARALLHETTHFSYELTETGATRKTDYVYGSEAGQKLAKEPMMGPQSAVMNADNYAFFAADSDGNL